MQPGPHKTGCIKTGAIVRLTGLLNQALISVMSLFFSSIARVFRSNKPVAEALVCVRQTPGWCAENLQNYVPVASETTMKVERLAEQTNAMGSQPLWEGYTALENYPFQVGEDAKRFPNQVRTDAESGNFFTWLVEHKKPATVLEFGAAFGVSGMYWLAGIEANGFGQLLSFEPNTVWAEIADKNFLAMSRRFVLTRDIFEQHVPRLKQQGVKADIALIDAIHTSEFVYRQLDLVLQVAAPGAVIILDDINFSDDMRQCWKEVSQQASKIFGSLSHRSTHGDFRSIERSSGLAACFPK